MLLTSTNNGKAGRQQAGVGVVKATILPNFRQFPSATNRKVGTSSTVHCVEVVDCAILLSLLRRPWPSGLDDHMGSHGTGVQDILQVDRQMAAGSGQASGLGRLGERESSCVSNTNRSVPLSMFMWWGLVAAAV